MALQTAGVSCEQPSVWVFNSGTLVQYNVIPQSMERCGAKAGLLNLPWEDVIHTQILSRLSWKDLFRLRLVSHDCCRLVNNYFSKCHCVDLSTCNNKITGPGFQIITKSASLLTMLVASNCKWLTDDLLKPVFEANPSLKHVDLSGCQSITTISMQILAIRCQLLRTLILRDCYWFTAAALIVIAFHCPDLHCIDMTSCWQVNDEAICKLVKRCLGLKYISLAKIYGITNSSLVAIAYHCQSLLYLDLVGCWRISDDGIKMIGEYCKALKTLKVRDCRDVSEASLTTLRNRVSIDLPLVPYPYNRATFLKALGLNAQI